MVGCRAEHREANQSGWSHYRLEQAIQSLFALLAICAIGGVVELRRRGHPTKYRGQSPPDRPYSNALLKREATFSHHSVDRCAGAAGFIDHRFDPQELVVSVIHANRSSRPARSRNDAYRRLSWQAARSPKGVGAGGFERRKRGRFGLHRLLKMVPLGISLGQEFHASRDGGPLLGTAEKWSPNMPYYQGVKGVIWRTPSPPPTTSFLRNCARESLHGATRRLPLAPRSPALPRHPGRS